LEKKDKEKQRGDKSGRVTDPVAASKRKKPQEKENEKKTTGGKEKHFVQATHPRTIRPEENNAKGGANRGEKKTRVRRVAKNKKRKQHPTGHQNIPL